MPEIRLLDLSPEGLERRPWADADKKRIHDELERAMGILAGK